MERIACSHLFPAGHAEHLLHVVEFYYIKDPVEDDEQEQDKDDYEKASSQDDHVPLGVELIVYMFTGRIAYKDIYFVDILTGRPVAALVDLTDEVIPDLRGNILQVSEGCTGRSREENADIISKSSFCIPGLS